MIIFGMVAVFIAIVSISVQRGNERKKRTPGSRSVAETVSVDRETFIELCGDGRNIPTIRAILSKAPALAEPIPNGRPLLHELLLRGDIPVEVLGVVLESRLSQAVNTPDMLGDTALHTAVQSGADPAVLLLLRAAGADPMLRDAGGKTPLERLLAGDHTRFAERDAEAVTVYGVLPYTVARRAAASGVLPTRGSENTVKGLVDDPELRLYFSLLVRARVVLAGTRLALAAIDDVEMPQEPLPADTETPEGELWRRLNLAPGTAGISARIKCLLPEALPESISWFSATAAGKSVKIPAAAEWEAWSAPTILRTAGVLLSSGNAERSPGLQESIRSMVRDELGRYAPSLRNTPLLVYSMLTVATPGSLKATLKEARDAKRNDEAVLYELWSKLSPEGQKRVGPHLTAAAAYNRVVRSRLSLLPPIRFFGQGADLEPLRLWGASEWPERPATGVPSGAVQNIPVGDIAYVNGEERRLRGASVPKDPGEPLVAAASFCMELSEKDALKMFDLLITAGNKPNVPNRNGRLPLDVARELKAPKSVLKVLGP